MVVDSPYRSAELVLTPRAGVLIGALGAVPIVAAFQSVAMLDGAGYTRLLDGLGVLVMRPPETSPAAIRLTGLALLALLAGLAGLLYAASQTRAPIRGLVAVGLFYGLLLWVISRVLLSGFLPEPIRHTVHSGNWAASCVAYGLWLAVAAAIVQRVRPGKAPAPKD